MKGNKGITLIALVVTIIVLLILAGVAIAMLTGENSILNRSKESAAANALGAAKDAVNLEITSYVTDYYKDVYVNSNTATQTAGLDTWIETKMADSTNGLVAKVEVPGVTVAISGSAGAKVVTLTYTADGQFVKTNTISGGVVTWKALNEN